MTIEEIQDASKKNDIDRLLVLAKKATPENVEEYIKIYEEYYNKEMNISKTIINILAKIKGRRLRNQIPKEGCYTYKLEE